ncbi:protein DENND6B isoform X2 [Patella vulgata]|uniref:protein DENND6B isoform X2 n=1 Tax=Patella vulgata TaxID=6465 RepID=UPI00217F24C7|nr:protein DENND6B isoform X2 [Patella vulgata]
MKDFNISQFLRTKTNLTQFPKVKVVRKMEEDNIERAPADENMAISPTILPWDKFSNWLHCACVVTFDLELGQAMELIYPGHIKLTEKEKMNICYLSFPDSNSGCMGNTQFHFRIRQCPGRKPIVRSHHQYNRDCPVSLQSENAYYYGFVYFRQTKDRTIRRGYFQKSLVLVSKLPFVALFNQVVSIIAPEYFDNGEPSLEAACHDIDQWPTPIPGDTLNLPMMGSVLQVKIPCRPTVSDKISSVRSASKNGSQSLHTIPAHTILPSLFEVDIYSSFQSILPHIQLLWELVLIGEPIAVMAASPTVTSNTVQALVNLIAPLKYCSDFRPYFTIHDSEFKEYTTKVQAPPPIILGVTNPFFAKTLQHWPHIIRIGEMNGGGVYTRYKSYLAKDKTILKRLLKGVQIKRPVEAQNAILRRHFLELTQSFMIPLERYIASLMPLQRNISPHKGPPRLRPFDPDEFLKTIEHSGPQLTPVAKGDWEGLYRRFFRSPNFEGWYHEKQREANQKLQALHMEALCGANLQDWIVGKEEVEIVDLILRIREKLAFAAAHQIVVGKESLLKLQNHMDGIVSALPEDLQSVLKT